MSARYVYAVVAILALAAGYACWCRAPLIWDGAYQFNATLIMQRPYYYLTRFHTFFLWWPTVWASRFTSNVSILQTVYGLPFLIAPVLAVVLSWWMVHRDAPYLIVWAIFGVAAGSLPGQIFVINDSIFQQHLFWPVFMGLFVPLSAAKKIVIGILAAFQFVHPLGVLLFFGATMAALLVAAVDLENRRRLLIRAALMTALCLFAVSKIYITNHIPSLYDDYAADEAKWSTALDRWSVGVRGWPLHGLWFMWSAAGMLFLWVRWRGRLTERGTAVLSILLGLAISLMAWEYRHQLPQAIFPVAACVAFYVFVMQFRHPSGPGKIVGVLPLLCAAAGAACWIHWAGDGRLWWKAIDYRRWVGPLSAPFFLLAVFDALAAARQRYAVTRTQAGRGFEVITTAIPPVAMTPNDAEPRRPLREPLALLLAVTFAMVISLQSTGWHSMSEKLMNTVMRYPATIVPESAAPWTSETPLDHWATADYVMAMQGKIPRKLFLSPVGEEHIYENPPKIPHWDFYPHARASHPDPTPGPVGWFDLRPLLDRLSHEPRPKEIGGPKRFDTKTTPE